MANNLKFDSGKRLQLSIASGAVAAGALTRLNGFIGIPLVNAVAGQTVAFALEGVWGMTFANYGGTVLPAAGSILYWDTTASALSLGAANDDYAAVKCVTAPTAAGLGAFEGLLLGQSKPYGQEQS